MNVKVLLLLIVLTVSLQAQTQTLTFNNCCAGLGPNPETPDIITAQGLSIRTYNPYGNGGSVYITNPTAFPFSDLGVTGVSNGTPSVLIPQFPGENVTITSPGGAFTTDGVATGFGFSFTNASAV